jgi:hypothetical protein
LAAYLRTQQYPAERIGCFLKCHNLNDVNNLLAEKLIFDAFMALGIDSKSSAFQFIKSRKLQNIA